MNSRVELKKLLEKVDLSDGSSIEQYALNLVGMTFREVLDLGITPIGYEPKDYGNKRYKGGMGNLLEERFFGYKSNSDDRADFPEAGVELKATCFDIRKKDHQPVAGERLVLSMIPFDEPIDEDFYSSHVWEKCRSMLLVYYQRDRAIDKYDQHIEYVKLFTPSEEDLKIIADDYRKIVSYIQAGRAHELSEGMTTYLGAATKGATEASSWTNQYYPTVNPDGTKSTHQAKKRAFSLKRQYMDYVLHHYLMGEASEAEPVVTASDLSHDTFEQHIERLIKAHVGKSDREIASEYGLAYTGNKAQWSTLVSRMLGVSGTRPEEFAKAGITVHTVRIEDNGKNKENLPIVPIDFKKLLDETWEESELRSFLDENRFFFVVFKKEAGEYRLKGCTFWNIPVSDLDGEVRRCWKEAQETIKRGVKLVEEKWKSGKIIYRNDLPGMADNQIAHVRHKADKTAYLLEDGTVVGDVKKDALPLPDGRWMTKQSFWLNNSYILSILHSCGLE